MTTMPEEIVRTYLVNPFIYGDATFCCGCSRYVNSWELIWPETGENVHSYMTRLRRDFLRVHFDLNVPEYPQSLIVTPPALKKLKEYIRELNDLSAVVILSASGTDARDVQLGRRVGIDLEKESLVELSGILFAVRRADVATLPGCVISYHEPLDAFGIARLYPPGRQLLYR